MSNIEEELKHLEEVKRRIAQGEARVAKQEERLETLRKDGHSTEKAEKTLAGFRGVVDVLRNTQRVIERTLEDIKAGKLQ